MSEGVSCKKLECPGQATWIPVLMLKSENSGKMLAASLPDIGICEMHKQGSKLEDFLSHEAWDRITKHLRVSGKGAFVRRATQLEWRKSQQEELLPF